MPWAPSPGRPQKSAAESAEKPAIIFGAVQGRQAGLAPVGRIALQVSKHPTAILDTNVVLDCLVFRNPACAGLADALGLTVAWLTTASMRAELAHVLGRGLGARWPAEPARVLAFFDSRACVEPEPPRSRLACADASDQVFIDLAVAHRAVLLTRDRALLKLARRATLHGAAVTTPEGWPMAR